MNNGYNSEHGQDKWLNENIFKNKRNGIFVEFGAIDGIITSNTLFFERELGWTGILSEPVPEMYHKIKDNRTCSHFNFAISDEPGMVPFMVYPHVIGWSGIQEDMETQHLERINSHGGQTEIIEVSTIRLNELLDLCQINKIDYLTIDTEGTEEKIIKSIDFERYDIGIIDIENNFGNYDITDFMDGNGYEKITRLGVNDIFQKRGFEF